MFTAEDAESAEFVSAFSDLCGLGQLGGEFK